MTPHKCSQFGIPVDGPTGVLCDNKSVVKNSSCFESCLNKKHNTIAYHVTRWATAVKEIIVGWIKSQDNLVDTLMKRLACFRCMYNPHGFVSMSRSGTPGICRSVLLSSVLVVWTQRLVIFPFLVSMSTASFCVCVTGIEIVLVSSKSGGILGCLLLGPFAGVDQLCINVFALS